MIINKNAHRIIHLLESMGYDTYAVGGCVRDLIMGETPHDWDLCTAAVPGQIVSVLEKNDIPYFDSGIKHGTVSAVLEGEVFEITTFRSESGYSDHRHPTDVKFLSDVREDLSRRDFTINAMAYSDRTGLVDPFEGESDITDKIIRCVGNSSDRFEEDALRLLRALRFSAQLSFKIENETGKAILEHKDLLCEISAERIREEFLKLLCAEDVLRILTDYRQVIEVFLPEIKPMPLTEQNHPYHNDDVWTHTVRTVEGVKPTPNLRMAALLHDIGKPAVKSTDDKGIDHFYKHPIFSEKAARNILHRLKFSSSDTDYICTLVKNHDITVNPSKKSVLRALSKLGEESFLGVLDLKKGDIYGQNPDFYERSMSRLTAVEKVYKEVKEEGCCFKLSDLAVNGNDLIKAGYTGKEIGRKLEELLAAVINGEAENDADVLRKLF